MSAAGLVKDEAGSCTARCNPSPNNGTWITCLIAVAFLPNSRLLQVWISLLRISPSALTCQGFPFIRHLLFSSATQVAINHLLSLNITFILCAQLQNHYRYVFVWLSHLHWRRALPRAQGVTSKTMPSIHTSTPESVLLFIPNNYPMQTDITRTKVPTKMSNKRVQAHGYLFGAVQTFT